MTLCLGTITIPAVRLASRTFLPAFSDLGGTFAFPKVGRILHRVATVDGGSSSLYIQTWGRIQKRKKVGFEVISLSLSIIIISYF